MKEYTFTNMEELKKFLEERKDDKEERYYYGDLYTIQDIEKDLCKEWFEDGGISTVYEFEEGEIEEEGE